MRKIGYTCVGALEKKSLPLLLITALGLCISCSDAFRSNSNPPSDNNDTDTQQREVSEDPSEKANKCEGVTLYAPCGPCGLSYVACSEDGQTFCHTPEEFEGVTDESCRNIKIVSKNNALDGIFDLHSTLKSALRSSRSGDIILLTNESEIHFNDPITIEHPLNIIGGYQTVDRKVIINQEPTRTELHFHPSRSTPLSSAILVNEVVGRVHLKNLYVSTSAPDSYINTNAAITIEDSNDVLLDNVVAAAGPGSHGQNGNNGANGKTGAGSYNEACKGANGGRGGWSVEYQNHPTPSYRLLVEPKYEGFQPTGISYTSLHSYIYSKLYDQLLSDSYWSSHTPIINPNGREASSGAKGGEGVMPGSSRHAENGAHGAQLHSTGAEDAPFPTNLEGKLTPQGWMYTEPPQSGQMGADGNGGGGGGAVIVTLSHNQESVERGARGGHGGAGGCGGAGGEPGENGGLSVGLVLFGSEVTLKNSQFSGARGGNGGKGGNPGLGGKGRPGERGEILSDKLAGDGGNGSDGLPGGFGAPGLPGHSFGAYCDDASTIHKGDGAVTFISSVTKGQSGVTSEQYSYHNTPPLEGLSEPSRGCTFSE